MAEPTFGLTMTIAEQTTSGAGVPEAAPANINGGTMLEAEGIVKRVAAGVNDSGIDFTITRDLTENARVGLSLPASTFKKETFSLEVSIPWAGNRDGTLVVDADFVPDVGPLALYKACGVAFVDHTTGLGQEITLGEPQIATVFLIGRNYYYTLKDCVGGFTITYTPGEAPVFKASLQGLVHAVTAGNDFPSETFGDQDTDPALVQGVVHTWDVLRDFTSMEITVDNGTEDVPSANSTVGSNSRNTTRNVTMSATVMNDDTASAEIAFQQYLRGTLATASNTFTVGDTAGNRIVHTFPKVEVRDMKNAIIGDKEGFELTCALVNNGTEGDEFAAEMT